MRLAAHAGHHSRHRLVQQHHKLGPSYGICVIFVTFFDTLMVTLVAILVWRLPLWVVFLPAEVFAIVDGLYLSSAINKTPDGVWFILFISALIAGIFLL